MKNKWISLPRSEGVSSRQAHADLPENSFERELGKEGFSGPATHMYHKHPPTSWTEINGPLRHRAFDTQQLQNSSQSPWQATELLHNQQLRVHLWQCIQSMESLVRNADGDELLFVHQGEGDLFCDYGHLHFSEGDYIMLPKGTLWRVEIHNLLKILMIEATQQHYQIADKGIVGEHAVFDAAVLDTPVIDDAFKAQQDEQPWRIDIKHHKQITQMYYPYNPLDAIGWHGTVMPVRLNWRDIRPLMSHRYHLPPSAHSTFTAQHFVVCTFVPRPLESDPGALRVPFYHSNDDYDEAIFYHQGHFFSRDNIHPGMITLHPCGIPHGPHPKAFEAGQQHTRKETDEVAVMIDSRFALHVSDAASDSEDRDYVNSWQADK